MNWRIGLAGLIAVLLVATGAAGLSLLARLNAAQAKLALADAQTQAARQQATQLQAQIDVDDAARQRGDELTRRLARSERALAAARKERDDAIAQSTTGLRCLGADAVRLFDGAPGLRIRGVPAPAGSAAAAGGRTAAAAGEPASAALEPAAAGPAGPPVALPPLLEASDSQVLAWALNTGALYETCRTRLQALIDFHRPAGP